MGSKIIKDLNEVGRRVPMLTAARLFEATEAAKAYRFQVTDFYVQKVLDGTPNDPLLDVILPSAEELATLPETWDENQALTVRAVDSALWSQKYPQEGLIRLNTTCSAYCRYCYVREQTARRRGADAQELGRIFEQLATPRAQLVREVILSGGDPLTASPNLLALIGASMKHCNDRRRDSGLAVIQLTIHTREPIWRPDFFLDLWESRYAEAFEALAAYAWVFQVLHRREVTPEFKQLVARIARASHRTPLLLCQHPLFRGINASAQTLAELYSELADSDAPIKPYYVVHPFDSGTLTRHRLSLEESQKIMQELIKLLPGILMPTLVVPTPVGKAYVSPFETLVPGSRQGRWLLHTKTGEQVDYVDQAATVRP